MSTSSQNILLNYRTAKSSPNIYLDDYLRLAPGRWLNDTLIEFHGMWVREALTRDINKRIHIFSPFLYPELNQELPRLDMLRRWIMKFNLFALGSLLIPVCTNKHWILAIICNPSLKEGKTKSQILLVDSMRQRGTEHIAGKLRSFVETEHGHRPTKLRITAEMLTVTAVEVPQQQNKADCGVFVAQNMLQYLICKSTDWDAADLPDGWRTEEEATHTRRELANTIGILARQQGYAECISTLGFFGGGNCCTRNKGHHCLARAADNTRHAQHGHTATEQRSRGSRSSMSLPSPRRRGQPIQQYNITFNSPPRGPMVSTAGRSPGIREIEGGCPKIPEGIIIAILIITIT
uniref:Ubiquitin-like protease family profile domain-containing protein n=1 Tax=Glossina brevipalpis TaxID=37001 RepID=A0A1A9W923_9MUSC